MPTSFYILCFLNVLICSQTTEWHKTIISLTETLGYIKFHLLVAYLTSELFTVFQIVVLYPKRFDLIFQDARKWNRTQVLGMELNF
jgi:hypothetical protein